MPLYLLHEAQPDGACVMWAVAAPSAEEAALVAADYLLEEQQIHRHMDRVRARDRLLARFTAEQGGPVELPEIDLPAGVYYYGPAP